MLMADLNGIIIQTPAHDRREDHNRAPGNVISLKISQFSSFELLMKSHRRVNLSYMELGLNHIPFPTSRAAD